VVDGVAFDKSEWETARIDVEEQVKALGLSGNRKTRDLGSSIAVSRVDDADQVEFFVDRRLSVLSEMSH